MTQFKQVGFIANVNRRASYAHLNLAKPIQLPVEEVKSTRKSAIIAKAIKSKRADKVDYLETKLAKRNFKVTNPNHQDRLLVSSKF